MKKVIIENPVVTLDMPNDRVAIENGTVYIDKVASGELIEDNGNQIIFCCRHPLEYFEVSFTV